MQKFITACIDGPNYSKSVLHYAVWGATQSALPLTLLHVLDKDDYVKCTAELSGSIGLGAQEDLMQSLSKLDEERSKIVLQHSKLLLSALRKQALERGVKSVSLHQEHGHFIEILSSQEKQTHLLVLGKSGEMHRNVAKAVGSQLESVLRKVHTDILIANEVFVVPNRYLLAFDGSEMGQKIIKKVCSMPLLRKLHCHLVMVDNGSSNTKQNVFLQAKQQLEQAGVVTHSHIIRGDSVPNALLDYQQAENLALCVMGAYGHSRLRQFFVGSTTTQLIAQLNIPILIIKE